MRNLVTPIMERLFVSSANLEVIIPSYTSLTKNTPSSEQIICLALSEHLHELNTNLQSLHWKINDGLRKIKQTEGLVSYNN